MSIINGKNIKTTLIGRWLRFFLYAVCTFISCAVTAQTGKATLERDQIVLGEQLKLTLKIDDVPEGSSLQSFFKWGTDKHVEVVDKGKMDTVVLDGKTTYIQHWTLTSFDSGKWSLPLIPAVVLTGKARQAVPVKIDSVYLNVMSVDISNMKDYHDIKDIISVKYFDPFWIIVGVIAIVVIGLLVLLIRSLRKRKKKVVKPQKITGNPLDWALEKIRTLQEKNLPVYSYFSELNEIVRNYLHEKANLPTFYKTSDELILKMKEKYSDTVVSDGFYQNLKLMDAVKFAKYQPSDAVRMSVTTALVDALQLFDKQAKDDQNK